MSIDDLYLILLSDNPREQILANEEALFELIPELRVCKGFNQNSKWHIYDVYEHILHVVSYVPSNLILRLTALFHDVGKPISYFEDEDGIGHFFGHWDESKKIFDKFVLKYNIDDNVKYYVSNLIFYHDINISKFDDSQIDELYNILGLEGIDMLYQFKKADLLAQNEEYHYILSDYDKQKEKIFSMYRK